MDADLSHDERLLPHLIRAIEQGAELAIGSRRVPGGGADRWPRHRRLISDVATRSARAWLKIKLSDPMSGYFVLRRALYLSCRDRLAPHGYKIMMEIYCTARPTHVRELPYIFKDRKQDYSKLTIKVVLQFLNSLWKLRRRVIN
jgi:dolichol-phosphate mannosyltransferase